MLVHTIVGVRIGISENKAMKLLISTLFTLLVIAFTGSLIAQGEEDRNCLLYTSDAADE